MSTLKGETMQGYFGEMCLLTIVRDFVLFRWNIKYNSCSYLLV